MARADTVSLTYTAEIADLKKKLAEIPGATGKEAKKAVAEVSKAVKLVAKAEAEAKKAAEGSAAGLKSLGDAAGKTNESFASMGAALSTVSPELGGMVSRIGAVANGLKGAANASQLMGGSLATMVGTLGIAGVAAGAAFIAYQTMAREMEQAAGMTRLLREVSDSLEPSLRQLESAELALAVATGATTKEQAAQITTQRAARDAVLDYAKAQRTQREEQQATIESAVKWKQAIDSATFGPLGKAAAWAADSVFGLSDSIEYAEGQLRVMDLGLQKQAAAQKSVKDAVLATTAATEANAKSSGKAAAAVQRETVTRGQLLAGVKAEQTAREQLAEMMGEINASRNGTEAEAAINAEFDQRVKLLDEIGQRLGYNAEVAAGFDAALIDRETALQDLRLKQAQDLEHVKQRSHEDAIKQIEAEARAQTAANVKNLSDYGAFTSGVADLAMASANAQADTNKQAAKQAFATAKAAGIATAMINGAIGVTKAWADLGPAAPFLIAGIVASTAAQVATIAAQKPRFNDTPGVVQMRGGGSANFAPGDMVVAGKDLSDMRRQIDVAQGNSNAPQVQVVAVPSYQGRTYELARRDALRMPGADFAAMSRARSMGAGGW
jgi:hypothetical protein